MYQPPGSQPPPPPGSPPPQFPPQPPQPGYGQPPQQPYGYAPGYSPGYSPARPTDSLAIWSAVLAGLGIPGFFLCCIPGIVLGAIAFFLGNSSMGRIRGSNGALGGEGLAQAGRIGGAIIAVISLLALVGLIVNGAINGGTTPSTTPTP